MNTANDFEHKLQHLLRCSQYASRILGSDTAQSAALRAGYARPFGRAEMEAALAPALDEATLSTALRRLRKQVMLRLMLRDLNGLCGLEEVMHTMTMLAEVAVQQAQRCVSAALHASFGQPIGEASGQPQELLVIGMGKLGGGELNVSSDIDLIFVYAEDGETDGARRIGNHEYFTRLGKRLIALINDLNGDGYVFRVDMRLRPYGDSGPLVMSFAALEEYLVTQGREWERYAWIKARVISPEQSPAIAELAKLAQPFVFRKYLDFGAFDSMRKLHAQIRAEVARRDRGNNIKLGPGGIREIEFIAQVFQLIRGGRDTSLRIRPTRQVLELLVRHQELSADAAARLDASYVFLRNLEHRLQYLDDQQTQELPDDPANQQTVALAMGYADYAALLEALAPLRQFVSAQFETIFSTKQEAPEACPWWHEGMGVDDTATVLGNLGYRAPIETAARLVQFRQSARYRQLPEISRPRLDTLVPKLTALCAGQAGPDDALARLLALLEAIVRRASYLAFLAEYPQALPRLVKMAAASAWACDYLTQHPILLDELLDDREIYTVPDWAALDAKLSAQLADCGNDTEHQMDALRQFQHAQTFHLLAMDLQGLLPLETLSDHLSDLADLMLRHVLTLCWNGLARKHREVPRFAIIAYGKLGGKELGYASDLDLVFLYDDDAPDANVIYARLGQRINTLLSSYTAAGRLYEVDLRLRPNGDSGLLVSSVAAFEEYQQQHAWVWEHQALTRARYCAGDADIGAAFERIRNDVLRQPRELPKLRAEIVAMRQKMHDGHPNKTELFDIKHDAGGMVDIEFMVQYLVLAHAHAHPELAENKGNLALLGRAADAGLIPPEAAEQVAGLYRELRRLQHAMRLNNQQPRVVAESLDVSACLGLWAALLA
ncbi:bifunctional [glutamate--ammonia ligase]-adenylyl-L-tyrosine phosphorylase/[glutamate--ammonia-ligase] adenylyltransferase [Ferriphaselus sp. R-1]|uniref:bifunctional [glutamate--ammonia ligase]-adenylyl-L-tyrosine phosphorylase/[glutamate--ammonia-ligase] adenylyltransferase n=1 Tax=Ferriphaselus sp. R-1 TaxID=1485544 RepID=UPI00054F9AAA|nr:bifunctional [glutamate--ammonia ligase]-adenylyl-L-tyrosine phosphorylase/[glutamate--ammonia-ligase] adenylyltransferase [Ferriphaselus sp. R-1]